MKLIYGNTPVKSLNINYFEQDTNSATVQPSDLQTGITCFARGQKITGTGKSFEFASYGEFYTNDIDFVPSNINLIMISSLDIPVQIMVSITDMKNQDFSTPIEIGNIFVDGMSYPVSVEVNGNFISITCEKTVLLEVFYGKDNYV